MIARTVWRRSLPLFTTGLITKRLNIELSSLDLNLTCLEPTNKRGIKGWVKRADWDNAYLEKKSSEF